MMPSVKRSLSIKEMRRLRPRLVRCAGCSVGVLQPTRDDIGSGLSAEDPVEFIEDATSTLYRLIRSDPVDYMIEATAGFAEAVQADLLQPISLASDLQFEPMDSDQLPTTEPVVEVQLPAPAPAAELEPIADAEVVAQGNDETEADDSTVASSVTLGSQDSSRSGNSDEYRGHYSFYL
jgi:hypothetical protein